MLEPIQKTFPNGRKVYAKMLVATGAILSTNQPYPADVDDAEIIGSDGTVKYLPVMEEPEPPVDGHDPDLFSVEPTKEVTAAAYIIRKVYKPRGKEERKARLRNIEALKRGELFPDKEWKALVIQSLAVIFTEGKGLTPTNAQKALKEKVLDLAKTEKKNADAVLAKEVLIDAGQDPNLSDGLEPTNAI